MMLSTQTVGIERHNIMAEFAAGQAAWGPHFSVTTPGDDSGYISLAQMGRSTFELRSRIEYSGPTGLEHLDLSPEALEELRHIGPDDLDEYGTDLASVPSVLRWWVNSYGVHTPAALIHDKFIGGDKPPGVDDKDIDRYFRFMLKDLGVRFAKRWLMWSAVAARTRLVGKNIGTVGLILWVLLALAGVGLTVASIVSGSTGGLLVALLAPIPASALWWRQAMAGIIAAYIAIPLILIPATLAGVFLVAYAVTEFVLSVFLDNDQVAPEPVIEMGSS